MSALIPRDDTATPFDAEALRGFSPWVTEDGKTTPALMAQAARHEAYVTVMNGRNWQVYFDPGTGVTFYECKGFRDRDDAVAHANRLRASWVALNMRAEGLTLIEDVALRNQSGFTPGLAYAILPATSARTTRPAFRSYVEGLILRTAPAHVLVRPIWCDAALDGTLTQAIADWMDEKPDAAANLRTLLAESAARGS